MIDTIICAAFCGTGKSYLCNNFPDTYKEIEDWEYRKGNFPHNYIKDVLNTVGEIKYLFISTDSEILNELDKMNIEFQLFYPQNELRNEYLDRFLDRNSPHDFIGAIMKYWGIWINEIKKHKCMKHTVLKTGEYLQDVL